MRSDFWESALTEVTTWIWLAIGIGLLMFLGVAVAIAYYLLLYLAMQYRFQQLKLDAAGIFDDVLTDHGDYDADDVTRVIFGAAPSGSGSHTTADLIFGVGVRHDD